MQYSRKRRPLPTRWAAEVIAFLVVILIALGLGPARAAVLDETMQAVFSVHSADSEDRFLGSAFLWGAAGEVAVTNAHVVGKAEEVRLVDATGRSETARVIARDPVRDVAVIAVAPGRRGLTATQEAPGLGTDVWALGAPLGIEFSVTRGMVSALARQVDAAAPIRMLQHDAAVNPGSSGGPLVDAAGGLLGMNSQIADGSRMYVGISYAISAADLERIVAGLIDETLLPLPTLGLRLRPVDLQLAAALGVKPEGLLVEEVTAKGVAGQAGLRAGDILLALAGMPLNAPGDLAFALETAQLSDEPARMALNRGSESLLLTLDLDAAPSDSMLSLRDIGGAMPQKVRDYTLATMGLTLDQSGVVAELTANSPALLAGVALGDRVLRVNGQEMAPKALTGAVFDQPVLLLLEGAGSTRHVLVDPFSDSRSFRPLGGANVLDPDVVVF